MFAGEPAHETPDSYDWSRDTFRGLLPNEMSNSIVALGFRAAVAA
jgi:hypothetical protein